MRVCRCSTAKHSGEPKTTSIGSETETVNDEEYTQTKGGLAAKTISAEHGHSVGKTFVLCTAHQKSSSTHNNISVSLTRNLYCSQASTMCHIKSFWLLIRLGRKTLPARPSVAPVLSWSGSSPPGFHSFKNHRRLSSFWSGWKISAKGWAKQTSSVAICEAPVEAGISSSSPADLRYHQDSRKALPG